MSSAVLVFAVPVLSAAPSSWAQQQPPPESAAESPAEAASPKEAPVTPRGRAEDPAKWGEWSIGVVERFGPLLISDVEPASGGFLRGAGVEARYMMPIGWGAYFRYGEASTSATDGFAWQQNEFVAGVARRFLRVGTDKPWSFRAQGRFDAGLGIVRTGTHETCTQSFVPFGTSCSTGPRRPPNREGDAFAIEARVGGDLGFGPIGLGVDVGIAAYLNYVTGAGSAPLPAVFYAPTAQLRLGFAIPFT